MTSILILTQYKIKLQKNKSHHDSNLFGQCCNYTEIRKLLKENIYIMLQVSVQNIKTSYPVVWEILCTSFFPSKPLGCYGDGGACFSKDFKLSENKKIESGQVKKINMRF